MKLKVVLIALLVLFTVFIVASLASLDWEKREVEIGFHSDVAKDNFTMAQRLLKANGISWIKDKHLAEQAQSEELAIDPKSILILDEAVLADSYLLDTQLADWVADGGRLIYVLNRQREELAIDNSVFFGQLGINVLSQEDVFEYDFAMRKEGDKNSVLSIDENTELELELSRAFYIENCPGVSTNTSEGKTVMCDFAFGQGRVVVMPSLLPFTNYRLRHLDHGSLLLWLSKGAKSISYVPYLTYPNWLAKLWHWSWQFVVTLVLLIVLAVWHITSRIGRAYAPDFEAKTSFNQHIRALANFYSEHGHEAVLFAALKKDFYSKVEVRVPNFKMLSADKQAQSIANLTHFEKQQVAQLLASKLPDSKTQRTNYIKRFKQLRNAL